MSEDTIESPEKVCCKTMMRAQSYDGPFYSYKLAGPTMFGVTVYKLTKSGKGISNAVGSRDNLSINFCPFCGQFIGRVTTHVEALDRA